jgi:hypothetical protein
VVLHRTGLDVFGFCWELSYIVSHQKSRMAESTRSEKAKLIAHAFAGGFCRVREDDVRN